MSGRRRLTIGDGRRNRVTQTLGEGDLSASQLTSMMAVATAIPAYQRNLTQIDIQKLLSMLLFPDVSRRLSPATSALAQINTTRDEEKKFLQALKREIDKSNTDLKTAMEKFWQDTRLNDKQTFEEWIKAIDLQIDMMLAQQEQMKKTEIKWAKLTIAQAVTALNFIFGNGQRVFTRTLEAINGPVTQHTQLSFSAADDEENKNTVMIKARVVTNAQYQVNATNHQIEMFAGEHAREIKQEIKAVIEGATLKLAPLVIADSKREFLQSLADRFSAFAALEETPYSVPDQADTINMEKEHQTTSARREVPVVTAAEQSQFQEIKQEVMDGLAVREAAALEIKTHAPGVTVDAGLEGVDDILSLLGEIDLAEPASFDKKSSDSTSITSQRASWPPLLFGAAPKAKPADHDHENHGPHA